MDTEAVYIHNGVSLSHKKSEMLPLATTWMDPGSLMLNEVSWRKTNTIWFHARVEFKKQSKGAKGERRHKPRNRLVTTENKPRVTRREEVGDGGGRGDGD